GIAGFEKETGISVPRDILPGLKGRLWLAVYPDREGPKSFVDGLIVIEDANGADPAGLAAKVRGYVEKTSGKESPVRFVQSERPSGTEWRLDPDTQRKLDKGFGSNADKGAKKGNIHISLDDVGVKDEGQGDGIPGMEGLGGLADGAGDLVKDK